MGARTAGSRGYRQALAASADSIAAAGAASGVALAKVGVGRSLRGPLHGDMPLGALDVAGCASNEAALEGEHTDEARTARAEHSAVR